MPAAPKSKPARLVPDLPTWTVDPEPIASAPVDAAPVSGDDDTSPLDYVLPGIALSLLLAASLGTPCARPAAPGALASAPDHSSAPVPAPRPRRSRSAH